MRNDSYYRLSIRFTNGEVERFIMREPIDGSQIHDRTRYAIVRTQRRDSDDPDQVFVACMDDVSYVKTQRLEQKELRHRVTGITGSIVEDHDEPETVATIQFV
jgi:hypothetical protein